MPVQLLVTSSAFGSGQSHAGSTRPYLDPATQVVRLRPAARAGRLLLLCFTTLCSNALYGSNVKFRRERKEKTSLRSSAPDELSSD